MSNFFSLVTELEGLLEKLNVIIAGSDNEVVTVNGIEKDSISKAINDKYASILSIMNGRKSYETKSLMEADTTISKDQLAEVWNDIEDNNGLYGFNGASWIKSPYDTIKNILSLIDEAKLQEKITVGAGLVGNSKNLYGPSNHENYRDYFTSTGISSTKLKGVNCVLFSESQHFSRAFSKDVFESGYVSFCLYIYENGDLKNTSTTVSNRIVIFQYDASGNEVDRSTKYAEPNVKQQWLIVDDFEILDSCSTIKFYVECNKANIYASHIGIFDGACGAYRPPEIPSNLWPDLNFEGFGLDAESNSLPKRYSANGIVGYELVPTGNNEYYMWSFPSSRQFKAGAYVNFKGEFKNPTKVGGLRAELHFYNENGDVISSVTDSNNTTDTESFRCRAIVPVDTFEVKAGFVQYQSATINSLITDISLTTDQAIEIAPPQTNHILNEIARNSGNVFKEIAGKISKSEAYADKGIEFGNLIKDPDTFSGFTSTMGKGLVNDVFCGKLGGQNPQIATLKVDPSRFVNQKGSFGLTIPMNNSTNGRVLIRMLETDIVEATEYRVTRNFTSADIIAEDTARDGWGYIVISDFYVPTDIISLKHVEIYIDSGPTSDVNRLFAFCNPWLVAAKVYNPIDPRSFYNDYWIDPTMAGNLSDLKGTVSVNSEGLNELNIEATDFFKGRTYRFPTGGVWLPGAYLNFHAELYISPDSNAGTSTEIAVIYYNEAGSEIRRQSIRTTRFSAYGGFESRDLFLHIPEETSEIAFRCGARADESGGGYVFSKFRNFIVSRTAQSSPWYKKPQGGSSLNGAGLPTVYVSPLGDDSASGSIDEPFKTGARASQELSGGGVITLLAGEHTNFTVPLGSIKGSLLINKPAMVDARIVQKDGLIEGEWSKQTGFENIWYVQASSYSGRFIWEHEIPQHPVEESERHPLQRGRSYRLPSFRLYKVTSLVECEENNGTWFYDSDDDRLYVNNSDGSDPNMRSYYLPTSKSIVSGNHQSLHLTVKNIDLWYAGFNVTNLGSYELHNIRNIGGLYNGCDRGSSSGVENRVEYSGNNNDGGNSHNSNSEWVGPAGDVPPAAKITSIDMYCHDNYDDGDSLHERCEGTYIGGLWEYNGDRGVATSYGAHVTVSNGMARHNGSYDTAMGQQNPGSNSGGEGFACVGSAIEAEQGIATQMNLFNCISSYNNLNFALNRGGYGDRMECNHCISEYGKVAGYSAEFSNRIMTLRNSTDFGSTVAKRESDGGQIIVKNGNLVI
ncbi:hypothetical protein [Pseudoalteromonas sp. NZS37]|uniref:hypothetical protein n=1 Tax=Pseudoalteromonas sp. NZS37 TaxID=2792071 RepID=UPI0018CD3BC1|nr:hypothetical protein [Pseudoalteromonas sp. NZS37]MBG9991605.1 hypothetical protein [Pseudoalteromonas sp. NZS37]